MVTAAEAWRAFEAALRCEPGVYWAYLRAQRGGWLARQAYLAAVAAHPELRRRRAAWLHAEGAPWLPGGEEAA